MKAKKKQAQYGIAVWAVDPFEKHSAPQAAAVKSLDRWAGKCGLRILPVYAASLPTDELERGVLKQIDRLQDALNSFVDRYKLRNALPAEILLDESSSRGGAVHEVLAFAARKKSAWLALSTHGRSGFQRLVFGSFAEGLLRKAKCPVLLLSGKQLGAVRNRVLFPTDFSIQSRRAFRAFLPTAKQLHFDLTLFHAISLPAPVYLGQMNGMPSNYIPRNYFPGEEARAKREGAAWQKWAKSNGVNARLLLSDEGVGMLTGSVILRAAKKAKASMIAMSSQSGPVDRMLLGSAAHEVFRSHQYPMWMFGPKATQRKLAPMPVDDRGVFLSKTDGKRVTTGAI